MENKNVEYALSTIRDNKIRWIDLQFTDLLGRLQHITIPSSEFTEESFSEGFGKLDGSSIRGFAEIHESDMVMVPIPETTRVLPWTSSTARILAEVHRGSKKGRFDRDPRAIAERAEAYQKELGYLSYFGPEPEFFLFDAVNVDVSRPSAGLSYSISSREAPWSNNGGFIVRHKEGYYPASPIDQLSDIRTEIVDMLTNDFGFKIEATHHEVATAGQSEINFKFSTLVETADNLQTLKYVTRNIAKQNNMIATFMPKPMFGDNGSGMHTHFSLWDSTGKRNMMYDSNDAYAELSDNGRYAIGGILKHARALSAIVSPTVNSYHRLIPGYEAPVYLAWSRSNRSAVVRVPGYFKGSEVAKRLEYRAPDPSCNPYLALSAILMAGLDGIKNKTDPGIPTDENIYHMDAKRRNEMHIGELPRSLDEALDELELDNQFLLPVFNKSLIDMYVDIKREECRNIASYPHPIELYHYLDS
ncbi:MAG: type I glutamate--ammonia ligase [Candidatus Micrarchaeaceae archaeon]|jgi:glutamine synthetase